MTHIAHMEWRIAARYPSFEVSEYGDVRRIGAGSRISGFIDADGYIRYSLTREDGVRTSICAHRLVLESFVGPPPSSEHEAAHGNGSRVYNHPTNLRWATSQENHDDRIAHGNSPVGSRNPKARISHEDVLVIRREYRLIKQRGSGRSVSELDSRYGLGRSQIIRIATGQAWTHVPMADFSEMEAG